MKEGLSDGNNGAVMAEMGGRRRRLDFVKAVKPGDHEEAAKRTRSSESNSDDQDVSDGSCLTNLRSSRGDDQKKAAKKRTCGHGAVSVIGRRREMEDAVSIVPGVSGEISGETSGTGYDFYGVYDGHGGSRVAHHCRDRVHLVLAEEVARRRTGGYESLNWMDAFAESFRRVDAEVALSGGGGGGMQASDATVGSTAVVAVVEPGRIIVANCGDSRAVLSRGDKVVALSCDHKPDRPDELERVEAAGGKVINWNGYRVLGVLATSRSIGDHYLKPYVTHEPEVIVTDRTGRDEFLILASDGLWDVISSEIACKLVRNCLRGRIPRQFPCSVSGTTAADAAALLAEVAVSQGSKDNISVVVVELKKFKSSMPLDRSMTAV